MGYFRSPTWVNLPFQVGWQKKSLGFNIPYNCWIIKLQPFMDILGTRSRYFSSGSSEHDVEDFHLKKKKKKLTIC